MSKRAFVTGGSGFIGGHLIPALQRDGWDVTCYDVLPTTLCRYINGNVLNPERLAESLKGHDVVFHLAALADVRSALQMPSRQVDQNFLATATLLEAMRREKVNRIAFASTAVVYGDAHASYTSDTTIREDRLPQATSIYGAMKFASESLITSYCHGYGLHADILRLVSVVGTGYKHGNLLDFYHKVKTNPARVEIYGSLDQPKFYIGADDVAEAFRLVVAREKAPHVPVDVWNVSTQRPSTIGDSLNAVASVLRVVPTPVSISAPWVGDLPALQLSSAKLSFLEWTPRQIIYDTMVETVRDFHRRGL